MAPKRTLVIVESPAKAGTIGKYLGTGYTVKASFGHVRDLPSSKLGVDPDNGFEPTYVIPPKSKKALTELKAQLKQADAVILATDLDREGEAISWHLAHALELEKKKIPYQRITFNEITKAAIQEALDHPRQINMPLVDAQQARRSLDRLVGYTLSPILWRKVATGLSAGRVQSVALRLIVDRERERDAFKPEPYWTVDALLETQRGDTFTARLTHIAGKKLEQFTWKTPEEVAQAMAKVQAPYRIEALESKPTTRRPLAPYTTSTFQQDAVNRLGMSSKAAMRAAQELYEGGFITYLRTDSVELASEAITAIRAYARKTYGVASIPEKPNFYKAKASAQEAHEAIRPTDVSKEVVPASPSAMKVYQLIRSRTLASQMAPAQLEQLAAVVSAGDGTLRATGQRVVVPGFLAVYGADDRDKLLPELHQGEEVVCKNLAEEYHETEPPPRYSEATLIKALEEHGIGRPSTYAATISTLIDRGYVTNEQRRLAPETYGIAVTDLLKQHFPDVVDLEFTARMEDELDKVATAELTYEGVLQKFWGPFNEHVKTETPNIAYVDFRKETDVSCPECGKPMMQKRGRFGLFLSCSNYPECKGTLPLTATKETGLICPISGKPLVERKAKRGTFLGSSAYPKVQFAIWKPQQLPAKIAELEKEGTEMPFKEQALAAFAEKYPDAA